MTEPTFADGYSDVDDVADRVVEVAADGNREILDLVPADEIERQLAEALEDPDSYDDAEWDAVVIAVKDALLARDLVIA